MSLHQLVLEQGIIVPSVHVAEKDKEKAKGCDTTKKKTTEFALNANEENLVETVQSEKGSFLYTGIDD
uniref:Uncharacterized protein n=1 Tax=Nymphaea colorata TaxID=210225 RepID=A0A5K1FNV3_9MAGN